MGESVTKNQDAAPEVAGVKKFVIAAALVLLIASGIGGVVVDLFAFASLSQPTTGDLAYENLKIQLLLSVIKIHAFLVAFILVFIFVFRHMFGRFSFAEYFGNPTLSLSSTATACAPEETASRNPRALLAEFSAETAAISREIFLRASVYLYVGILIASIGVLFFAWRSFGSGPPPHGKEVGEFLDYLIPLLPSAALLFFIEFIAFFFLRQHRITMDEFRYFDAVRRNREENLVILRMFSENGTVVQAADVLKAMNIYSATGRLGKEETTEMLEMRKLHRDEAVLFEKILGAIEGLRKSTDDASAKEKPGQR